MPCRQNFAKIAAVMEPKTIDREKIKMNDPATAPVRESVRHRVVLPGIDRTYRLMHVTDVHVSTAYPEESEDFRKEAELRGGTYFPPSGGYSAAERFPLFFKEAEKLGVDGVLLTGDIIDFASRSNIDILTQTLKNTPVKAVYCLGNHDWSSMYNYHSEAFFGAIRANFNDIVNRGPGAGGAGNGEPAGSEPACAGEPACTGEPAGTGPVESEHICAGVPSGAGPVCDRNCTGGAGNEILPPSPHYRLEDMGPFNIFAVDDSCDRIAPEAVNAAETVFSMRKPVLVACHIPFYSKTLEAPTFDYWKNIFLIGGKGIKPDAPTARFMELMFAENSPVFAVAAGHIHFNHDDLLTAADTLGHDNVPIAAPNCPGNSSGRSIVQFTTIEAHAGDYGIIEIAPQ